MSSLAAPTLPESRPAAARLSVVHETEYRYAFPVEMAQHVACLRPLNDAGQRLRQFEMSVGPQPGQHSVRTDAFGNSLAFFSLYAPHSSLVVTASSEVEVQARYKGIDLACSLTVGEVQARLAYRAHAAFQPATEFAYASAYVPLHQELRDYAQQSLRRDRSLAEAVHELMGRIHRDFKYAPLTTDISTPILQVFRERQGVCQDFAHLMIGCLRACGLSARYVSGYLLTHPPAGQPRLVGADASHAWLSVWCPGLGLDGVSDWLDLDPTNDCIPGLDHIRVAHGRDFGDVTPLRGVIRGGGQHTLMVRVTTRPVEECQPQVK
jgi:transglutaminase-like putative cysteine protease